MDALVRAYREGKLILFAGAGVSAGLGLPTSAGLAAEMARQLGCETQQVGDYAEFRQIAEFYKLRKGQDALREWLAREWQQRDLDVARSDVHRLIAQGDFHSIYTTNYDHWIERAHEAFGRPYLKIASVRDLPRITEGVRQIVKFHGDLDAESDLVVDESSYFERLTFEGPLDIKLRADVLGNSVLFVGYSISDINIRLLFYRLTKIWGEADPAARPPSYLFTHRQNPIAAEVLRQWGINVLCGDCDDPGEALRGFLAELTA